MRWCLAGEGVGARRTAFSSTPWRKEVWGGNGRLSMMDSWWFKIRFIEKMVRVHIVLGRKYMKTKTDSLTSEKCPDVSKRLIDVKWFGVHWLKKCVWYFELRASIRLGRNRDAGFNRMMLQEASEYSPCIDLYLYNIYIYTHTYICVCVYSMYIYIYVWTYSLYILIYNFASLLYLPQGIFEWSE